MSEYHFREHSPEWQETTDGHVNSCMFVPGLDGNLTSNVTSPARCLKAARSVLPYNASDDGEWKANKHPRTQQ